MLREDALEDNSWPPPRSAGFLNKVAFLSPGILPLDLLVCRVAKTCGLCYRRGEEFVACIQQEVKNGCWISL